MKVAFNAGMSMADYTKLFEAIKEADEHARKLKRANGNSVIKWIEIDIFTPDSAFVPVHPEGYSDNAMYRSVSLVDIINEVNYSQFLEIKATALSNALKESEDEYLRIKAFFDANLLLED